MLIALFVSEANAVFIGDRDGDLLKIESDGSMPMTWQDPTEPVLIVHASKVHKFTTLASDSAIDDRVISVVDASTCIAGDSIKVISPRAGRFYIGHIVSVSTNDITLDSPLDYAHLTKASIACANENLAVDGSVTPQIFSLRAADPTGAVPVTVHITRIIIECITDSAVSLDKFGNIAALTNGLVMRRVDGVYNNIFNVKTLGDLAGLAYDVVVYEKSAPADNIDGFTVRMTFAGPSKMGTAIEVGPGEDIQFIVSDNLEFGTPDIIELHITFQGHVKLD